MTLALYADWMHSIAGEFPRLRRCVDDARHYRAWFPVDGADRD